MGAKILSIGVAERRRRMLGGGGMKLAEHAALACLERAGRRAEEIELLINAGVYHDRNLGEPALAALIQADIGANPGLTERTPHGTFSFDVENGGAGVLTALHLLDGFLSSAIELGMVVASDAHPGTKVEPEFPFASLGAAALLAPATRDEQGFVAFRFDTYPEFEKLFESRIAWHERGIRRGRNVLEIAVDPGFESRAVDCALDSTRRFLKSAGLGPHQVDLWVPSQWPLGFADAFAEGLGVNGDRIARVGENLSGAHSAGLLAALSAAEHDGRWAEAKTVAFIGVGAGISTGLALYRNV
jgi:3-oxoacyl-[acyl-carrier-protein] synthase-3